MKIMDKKWTNRGRIVDTAREYLGTPFHHQGRLKGVGVDCIGLLVGVAREMGLFVHDNTEYSRRPDGRTLLAELRKVLDEIPVEDAKPGDILVFWFQRRTRHPQHVGIKSEVGIIHTYEHIGRVVEAPIGGWVRNITNAFQFRGIE